MTRILLACLIALYAQTSPLVAETYTETFECTFGKGVRNRPTPTRVLFSIDEFGRSALLHNVEIPKIDTVKGSGQITRNSIRRLSIAWSGREYIFSASGRSVASNETRPRAVDLRDVEFTIFLDRRTMKASVRSNALRLNVSRDGHAKGKCLLVTAPK
jgi:hypothetical protein